MNDCLFCMIAAKSIPTKFVYEDEYVVAFEDIKPVAPVHVLIIPKKHIRNISECSPEDCAVINAMVAAVKTIAIKYGVENSGFRIVANTNDDGGQTVHHLHWHLIGGRRMTWPPG